MDVKGATRQKVAAVRDELSALIRKEKSFDEARDDLARFLKRDGTKKALTYLAMCIPPAYNIVQLVELHRSDESKAKKAFLTFENVGAYGLTGAVMWSWLPPAIFAVAMAGVYSMLAPLEWALIHDKRLDYAVEKRLHAGETVGYIRMEDKGNRTRLGRKRLTAVVYPVDNPRGKEDIVGYRKRLADGRVYSYYPEMIADPDTKTKGASDLKNWASSEATRKEARLGYFVTQAQVFFYSAVGYAVAYVLTDGKGILPMIANALSHLL